MAATRPGTAWAATATLLGASLAAVLTPVGSENARGESGPAGTIAFLRSERQGIRLWTMRPDGSAERRLPPKNVAFSDLRWSPNAKRIVFAATRRGLGKERSSQHDELFVVNADGSGVRRLTWTRTALSRVFHENPSWSPDGRRIVFDKNDDGPKGIYVVNANGGRERALIRSHKAGWLWPRNSALSPDGRKIALTDGVRVFVLSAGGGARPRPVARVQAVNEVSDLTWSPDGRKIAVLGEDLLVMQRDGSRLRNVTRKLPEWKISGAGAWSPDGRTIAVAVQEKFREPFQIWLVNADGTGKHKLTTAPRDSLSPVWSPDGTRIAFASGRDVTYEIYAMNADGSDQRLLAHNAFHPAWSKPK